MKMYGINGISFFLDSTLVNMNRTISDKKKDKKPIKENIARAKAKVFIIWISPLPKNPKASKMAYIEIAIKTNIKIAGLIDVIWPKK